MLLLTDYQEILCRNKGKKEKYGAFAWGARVSSLIISF